VKYKNEDVWLLIDIRSNSLLSGQMVISINPFFVIQNHFPTSIELGFHLQHQFHKILLPGKGEETKV